MALNSVFLRDLLLFNETMRWYNCCFHRHF